MALHGHNQLELDQVNGMDPNDTRYVDELNAKMELICHGPPPSVDIVIKHMSYMDLSIHLISIVMMFLIIFLFVEECIYLKDKIRSNYRRRRMSMLVAGIPTIFATTSVVGTFFPKGHLMIDFVSSVYFGFAMHGFLNLIANYFGGVTSMIDRLKGQKIVISTMPLFCICKCLPTPPMTRKLYKLFYYLTLQVALVRPLVLFVRGVFLLDHTVNINDMVFTVFLVMSTLIAMWALVVFRKFSHEPLGKYRITAKFFALQMALLVSNVQPALIKIIKVPCVPPYTVHGRILAVNYQIMILEFFLLSIIMRFLYRSKADGTELDGNDYAKCQNEKTGSSRNDSSHDTKNCESNGVIKEQGDSVV